MKGPARHEYSMAAPLVCEESIGKVAKFSRWGVCWVHDFVSRVRICVLCMAKFPQPLRYVIGTKSWCSLVGEIENRLLSLSDKKS